MTAKQATNGIPFSKFALSKGVTKGTPAYKAAQKEYDGYCDVMRWAKFQSASLGKVRLKTSLLNPSKHRITEVSGTTEGTVLHRISEAERAATNKAFWDSRAAKQTPAESGLSDADYIALAKHSGLIPLKYQVRNSNDNLVYTKESCAAWIADYTSEINASRKAATDTVAKAKQSKAA